MHHFIFVSLAFHLKKQFTRVNVKEKQPPNKYMYTSTCRKCRKRRLGRGVIGTDALI